MRNSSGQEGTGPDMTRPATTGPTWQTNKTRLDATGHGQHDRQQPGFQAAVLTQDQDGTLLPTAVSLPSAHTGYYVQHKPRLRDAILVHSKYVLQYACHWLN